MTCYLPFQARAIMGTVVGGWLCPHHSALSACTGTILELPPHVETHQQGPEAPAAHAHGGPRTCSLLRPKSSELPVCTVCAQAGKEAKGPELVLSTSAPTASPLKVLRPGGFPGLQDNMVLGWCSRIGGPLFLSTVPLASWAGSVSFYHVWVPVSPSIEQGC